MTGESMIEGVSFLSSPGMVEEFKRNLVWRDMVAILEGRIGLFVEELKRTDPGEVTIMARVQGAIAELEDVIVTPEAMIEEMISLEEEKQIAEEEEGDG